MLPAAAPATEKSRKSYGRVGFVRLQGWAGLPVRLTYLPMNSLTRPGLFPASMLLRVLALGALLMMAVHAAEDDKRNYNLAAGDAAVALRQFSEASGRETLYAAEIVRGVKTSAVLGEFTALEALNRMLAGTNLYAVKDEKSGALAISRLSPGEKNAGNGRAGNNPAKSTSGDDVVLMTKYEVTGERVTGLINQGVIPRQEREAIPFVVMSRAEIEATGATDINEVFRSLPQVASFESESQSLLSLRGFSTFGAGVTPATKIDMRGFGVAGTTILVNGRRMPLVRETQGGGPDLGRIPLSAIDRIEVLPSSAGGMYGTNSMGGVINIILRKEYTGRELTVSYAQAAAGGANETGLTYTEGRSLLKGKANLTWTVDLRDRRPMYYRDRPLYRKFLEYNPSPLNGGTIESWDLSGGIYNFVSIPGVIIARNNSTFAIEPLNIPGAVGTVNYATVPLRQDGASLTPASFLSGANQINPYDPYGDFAMFNPARSANLNATFNHEIVKDRLSWYAELGLGYSDTHFTSPVSPRSLSLSATDPRNPFRTGVVPGYPGQRIQLYYYPADLPGTFQHTRNITSRLVLGVNGKFHLLGHEWKWSLDGSSDYNARKAFGYTPDQLFNSLANAGSTNLLARAFYLPFADHLSNPNATASQDLTNTSFRQNDDYVWMGSGVARLNGSVWDLPAGPISVSLMAEHSSQDYENIFKNRADEAVIAKYGLTYGPNPPINFQWRGTSLSTTRATTNGGAEVVVPVLGRDSTLLGIHRLDVLASTSRTAITDSKPFSAYNVGIQFAPVPDAMLRVSYGSGTYPAQEFMTTDSAFTDVVGSTTRDPRRGNTAIGNYTSIGGGNPDLLPEETETWNFGLILEPSHPRLKGFNATFDYGFIGKVNGITSMDLSTLLANEQYFPGRVERAAPTAGDAALNWAGQIARADLRRFNTGNIWTQYLDTSVRYHLSTQSLGSFYFTLRATNTREYKIRLRPNTPITDTLDQILAPLKFRGSGSVAWRMGRWMVTPSWSYIESYRDALNVPVEDSLTTNLQVVYEFPAAAGRADLGQRLLQGTQWTLGVNNIFDHEPPYVLNPGGQNFRSYYSTFDDPRGRYVYCRIKKSF